MLLEKMSSGAAWAPAPARPPHPSQTRLPLSTAPPSCLICLIRPLPAAGRDQPPRQQHRGASPLCLWGSQPGLSPDL